LYLRSRVRNERLWRFSKGDNKDLLFKSFLVDLSEQMVVLFLSFRIEVSGSENIISVSATELSLFKLIPDDLSEQMVVLFLSFRIEVSGSENIISISV